jgi:hypothetical protein
MDDQALLATLPFIPDCNCPRFNSLQIMLSLSISPVTMDTKQLGGVLASLKKSTAAATGGGAAGALPAIYKP